MRHGESPSARCQQNIRNERRLLGEAFSLREKDPSCRQRNRRDGDTPLKYRHFLWAAILLPLLAALPAFSGHGRKPLSSTKGFIIDGKRFLVEESAGNDLSLLSRELTRQGLNVVLPGKPSATHPFFDDALREDVGNIPPPAMSLPPGFHPERTLRLESGTGPIDLAFGEIDVSGRTARNRLSASGWECVARDDIPPATSVATQKKGRETAIVFLEEKEGKFLLVRRLE